MSDEDFWELIEKAWHFIPEKFLQERNSLYKKPDSESLKRMASVIVSMIVPLLEKEVERFPKEKIIAFEHVLAKLLFDIDREDVIEILNGGDDGFLYKRGFVVGMGEKYYQALSKNPSWAVRGIKYWPSMGASAEQMCFFPRSIFNKKYAGEYFKPIVSKETGSNKKYWNQ